MKKFKYFLWTDPNMGWGEGTTIWYIEAISKEEAKQKLIDLAQYKHDPDFIRGDVKEVQSFIQPDPIPII